jgi:hypothetical protein
MMQSRWWTALGLIIVVVIGFLVVTGSFMGVSTQTVTASARARCIEAGFPAENMHASAVTYDSGFLGFGGYATVQFDADATLDPNGKRKTEPLQLRVELRRWISLTGWRVASLTHEP